MGVSEKCKLTGSNLAEERFDSVFWKNKIDGTQNLIYNGKWCQKCSDPQLKKCKIGKIDFWLYYDLDLVM